MDRKRCSRRRQNQSNRKALVSSGKGETILKRHRHSARLKLNQRGRRSFFVAHHD